jgi:hypothetical protein
MPVEINVIMLTSPWRSDRAAEEMNGQPPHQTTGVARTNPNHDIDIPNGGSAVRPSHSPIGEKITIGIVRIAETTNLRSIPASDDFLAPTRSRPTL